MLSITGHFLFSVSCISKTILINLVMYYEFLKTMHAVRTTKKKKIIKHKKCKTKKRKKRKNPICMTLVFAKAQSFNP